MSPAPWVLIQNISYVLRLSDENLMLYLVYRSESWEDGPRDCPFISSRVLARAPPITILKEDDCPTIALRLRSSSTSVLRLPLLGVQSGALFLDLFQPPTRIAREILSRSRERFQTAYHYVMRYATESSGCATRREHPSSIYLRAVAT